jgi:hypothetical protein
MIATMLSALMLAGPAAPPPPDAIVRALYKLKSIPTSNTGIERFFASDLGAAIKKDIAGSEVGETNDGDYRYNAQDTQITRLSFSTRMIIGGAEVTARYRNYDKPGSTTYLLCERIGGQWRIADVRLPKWDMRKVLNLGAAPVRC